MSQIGYVEMVMPNIHYFTVNMAPFGMSNKDEVNVCKSFLCNYTPCFAFNNN